jgi:hypothetical protein
MFCSPPGGRWGRGSGGGVARPAAGPAPRAPAAPNDPPSQGAPSPPPSRLRSMAWGRGPAAPPPRPGPAGGLPRRPRVARGELRGPAPRPIPRPPPELDCRPVAGGPQPGCDPRGRAPRRGPAPNLPSTTQAGASHAQSAGITLRGGPPAVCETRSLQHVLSKLTGTLAAPRPDPRPASASATAGGAAKSASQPPKNANGGPRLLAEPPRLTAWVENRGAPYA